MGTQDQTSARRGQTAATCRAAAAVRLVVLVTSLMLTGTLLAVSAEAAPNTIVRATGPAGARPELTSVSVNGEKDYLGLGGGRPVFDWSIATTRPGIRQSAYQIKVLQRRNGIWVPTWTTGRVRSARQAGILYRGPSLRPATQYRYSVRVWDERGSASGWLGGSWETVASRAALRSEWIGRRFSSAESRDAIDSRASQLRRAFVLESPPVSARLYSTALGVYVPWINARRASSDFLAPGWTDYTKRVQLQTYDVTRLLRKGRNVIGFDLSTGWYAGSVGTGGKNTYGGSSPAVKAVLVVMMKNGQRTFVRSDSTWRAIRGPVMQSDLQDGERFDGRLARKNWTSPNVVATSWPAAKIITDVPAGAANLVPQSDPPVRITRTLRPRSVRRSGGGWLFDFGQNVAGVTTLQVSDQTRGAQIRLRHIEALNPDGTPHTANLRNAEQSDLYIARGARRETWTPKMTQHGFRYVLVSGARGRLSATSLRARVLGSDLPEIGRVRTSSALFNKIISNTMWSQRSNFMSIPTDCPQRSERLGWTGDINMFAPTAAKNMDIRRFLGDKWMGDLDDAQDAAGRIGVVVPQFPIFTTLNSGNDVVWAGASVTVPYVIWQSTGDSSLITENWRVMSRFVDSFVPAAPTSIFADWAPPPPDPEDANSPLANSASNPAVALAWYKHLLDMMGEMAAASGRAADAAEYRQRSETAARLFRTLYTLPGGLVGVAGLGDQTQYALAIDFDLLLPRDVPAAGRRLLDLVRTEGNGWDIDTGFAGFPRILDALTKAGQLEGAYRLLQQRDYPSLGYQIDQGSTTIWEFWNAVRPDGTVTDSSLNHYAFGSVVDWIYREVAGLQADPASPGYARTVFAPAPGGGLTSAAASIKTPRGRVSSSWTLRGGVFTYAVEVPANSTGVVQIPARLGTSVRLVSGSAAHASTPVRSGAATNVEVAAGRYVFQVR